MKKTAIRFPRHSFVAKNRHFLKKISTASKRKDYPTLKVLIKGASNSEIEAISEAVRNFLNSTFPNLSVRYIQRMLPFKNQMRNIASTKTSALKKKKLFCKKVVFFR